jgi:hypothetical protein
VGRLEDGNRVAFFMPQRPYGGMAEQALIRRGARTVVAGRNQRVLDQLMVHGADAAIKVDRPRDELAAARGPTT